MVRWILGIAIAVLVVAFVAVRFVVPDVIGDALRTQAEARGLTVSFDGVHVSPLTLTVALEGVVAGAPDAPPLVRADRLSVDLEGAALLDALVHVREVRLTRLHFETEWTDEGILLPPLSEPEPDADDGDATWSFRLDRAHVDGARVVLTRPAPSPAVDARIDAMVSDFRWSAGGDPPTEVRAEIEIEIASGEIGLEGTIDPADGTMQGELRARDLALERLGGILFPPFREWWGGGEVATDLAIARSADGEWMISGEVRGDALAFRAPEGDGLRVEVDDVTVPLESVRIGSDSAARLGAIVIEDVRADVWSPDPALDALTAGIGPTEGGTPFDVSASALQLTEGRIAIHVRTPAADGEPAPPFDLVLDDVALEATDLERARNAVGVLDVRARVNDAAPFRLQGGLGADTTAAATLDEIPIVDFQPLIARTGLEVTQGTATLESTVAWQEDGARLENHVVLRDLAVQGQDSALIDAVGVPVQTAVALLTDLEGRITLDVPVTIREGTSSIAIGEILRGAVGDALQGAVTTPLKLVGGLAALALPGADDRGDGGLLDMPAGTADLSSANLRVLDGWASLVEDRPRLRVRVVGRSHADEQSGEELATERRDRVVAALRERVEGDDRVVADETLETGLPIPGEGLRTGARLVLDVADDAD